MHREELIPIERRERQPVLRSISEGLKYTFHDSAVFLALAIFLFVCTASINFNVLLPLIASNTLHTNSEVYGLLTSCFGAGALIGALISASLGRATWKILLGSALIFGISECVLAIQRTIIGTILLLLITGISYTIYTSNTNTLVQLSTPGYLQGRVAGLYSYIFAGTNSIGSLLDGALAELGGTQLAFFIGGGTALICAAIGMLFHVKGITRPKGSL